MSSQTIVIATAFGLEAVVSRELKALGYHDLRGEDGRISFEAPLTAVPHLNYALRAAERVRIQIGRFSAPNFDELFERTKALPWEEWLPRDAKFPVTARSVRSMLTSTPHVQGSVKKAIVERLKAKYRQSWFDETGAEYPIEVSLLKDEATLTVNTSGEALHRRGYRTEQGDAPLKETLAAALLLLTNWRGEGALVDPFCGSGTIPIEAALLAYKIPPGFGRSFLAQSWPQLPPAVWQEVRERLRAEREEIKTRATSPEIRGSDISAKVLKIAQANAERAGVRESIRFECASVEKLKCPEPHGVIVCNPPYGERLEGDIAGLYRTMGEHFPRSWSTYVLTSEERFEHFFGRRAEKKRKLYNGRLRADYYQFPPPKGR